MFFKTVLFKYFPSHSYCQSVLHKFLVPQSVREWNINWRWLTAVSGYSVKSSRERWNWNGSVMCLPAGHRMELFAVSRPALTSQQNTWFSKLILTSNIHILLFFLFFFLSIFYVFLFCRIILRFMKSDTRSVSSYKQIWKEVNKTVIIQSFLNSKLCKTFIRHQEMTNFLFCSHFLGNSALQKGPLSNFIHK